MLKKSDFILVPDFHIPTSQSRPGLKTLGLVVKFIRYIGYIGLLEYYYYYYYHHLYIYIYIYIYNRNF